MSSLAPALVLVVWLAVCPGPSQLWRENIMLNRCKSNIEFKY